MNRERAKELLPIIQAFADGKTIQAKKIASTGWIDVDNYLDVSTDHEWRVKPEPREFWIFTENMRAYTDKMVGPNPEEDPLYIKVREVCDDC